MFGLFVLFYIFICMIRRYVSPEFVVLGQVATYLLHTKLHLVSEGSHISSLDFNSSSSSASNHPTYHPRVLLILQSSLITTSFTDLSQT